MKTINFEIKMLETVDGYRVDISDWSANEFIKLNPETKKEALAIINRYLFNIQETEIL